MNLVLAAVVLEGYPITRDNNRAVCLVRLWASQGRVRPLHCLFADKLQTVGCHRKPFGQNLAGCRLPVADGNRQRGLFWCWSCLDTGAVG